MQFLFRHKNGRYYVHTFASGKEKWTNREHLDAAERRRLTGTAESEAIGNLTFGEALKKHQARSKTAGIRPNTKPLGKAGIKLILRHRPEVEVINLRQITPPSVENWLVQPKASPKPHTPLRAKSPGAPLKQTHTSPVLPIEESDIRKLP